MEAANPRKEAGAWRHPWQLLLSAVLVVFVALSIAASESFLAAVVVLCILAMVAIFRFVFASGRAFCITLANLVAVYGCLFLFFVESSFAQARIESMSLAFVLPLLGFVAGSFRHRAIIADVAVSGWLRDGRDLPKVLLWLIPVFGVGALSFLVPGAELSAEWVDVVLVAACGAIALIVFFVSRDVAEFLRDTGLLFDEFFRGIAGLAVPAFAFLSFYSLLVILFAAFYSVLDHAMGGASFRIDGVVRAISFSESLYFSLMTLSTVGYGDIAPASSAIRLLAAAEIVSGILLLLFGFNEIFSFSRVHRREH
ncbi:MAG TPA: potassium channel family protein [Stellaceae bacterium]|nr:potassium channel family protein [Stellaceae bacterium]